jgi:hypothetical protein
MAMYQARVVLHGISAEHAVYRGLDEAMAALGFSRTIADDESGACYALPSATYLSEDSALPAEDVYEQVVASVEDVLEAHYMSYLKFAVLLSMATAFVWGGLKVAGPAATLARFLAGAHR